MPADITTLEQNIIKTHPLTPEDANEFLTCRVLIDGESTCLLAQYAQNQHINETVIQKLIQALDSEWAASTLLEKFTVQTGGAQDSLLNMHVQGRMTQRTQTLFNRIQSKIHDSNDWLFLIENAATLPDNQALWQAYLDPHASPQLKKYVQEACSRMNLPDISQLFDPTLYGTAHIKHYITHTLPQPLQSQITERLRTAPNNSGSVLYAFLCLYHIEDRGDNWMSRYMQGTLSNSMKRLFPILASKLNDQFKAQMLKQAGTLLLQEHSGLSRFPVFRQNLERVFSCIPRSHSQALTHACDLLFATMAYLYPTDTHSARQRYRTFYQTVCHLCDSITALNLEGRFTVSLRNALDALKSHTQPRPPYGITALKWSLIIGIALGGIFTAYSTLNYFFITNTVTTSLWLYTPFTVSLGCTGLGLILAVSLYAIRLHFDPSLFPRPAAPPLVSLLPPFNSQDINTPMTPRLNNNNPMFPSQTNPVRHHSPSD